MEVKGVGVVAVGVTGTYCRSLSYMALVNQNFLGVGWLGLVITFSMAIITVRKNLRGGFGISSCMDLSTNTVSTLVTKFPQIQKNGRWEFHFMTEWPNAFQINIWVSIRTGSLIRLEF